MFESNFPVDKLSCLTLSSGISSKNSPRISADERAAMFQHSDANLPVTKSCKKSGERTTHLVLSFSR